MSATPDHQNARRRCRCRSARAPGDLLSLRQAIHALIPAVHAQHGRGDGGDVPTLTAQEAKAWARIGDRRQTEVALDRGRRLLDSLPYPEDLDNHFVVDPTKFDFYAMDCYRMLAEDKMAETLADEVIRASTDFDGTERAPMRLAEARVTLGVVA